MCHCQPSNRTQFCPKCAQKLFADNNLLREALVKAREDINWMLNSEQFLNSFVFDYIDKALDSTK